MFQKAGDTVGGSAAVIDRLALAGAALCTRVVPGKAVAAPAVPGGIRAIWSFLPGSGKGHSSCLAILAACNAERHRLYTPHVYASCPFRHSRHWRAMRASNQPVHPGAESEAREASPMDCQSIAATETNNIGPRSAANRVTQVESRFSRRTSLLLGALPSAVPCARLHARQVLWEWGTSKIAETAELLLSELVTNAVQGAQATVSDLPVNVRLSANRDRLLIEVWDSNVRPPVSRVARRRLSRARRGERPGPVSRGNAERAMGLGPDAESRGKGHLVRTRPDKRS